MNHIEAMKQALAALEAKDTWGSSIREAKQNAITSLRQAIAEAEKQEQGEPAPVAKNENGSIKWLIDDWPQNCLLYTHTTPQQRKPLTDEQKFALIEKCLGLKKRTEDTVIDRYTGLFTDSARYFILIDAAYNFKE